VTCHRVEVFACLGADVDARDWLNCFHEAPDAPDAVVVRTEAAAVTHLFRVAAGLDSAIAGEPQILGQLRRAYAARATALPSLLAAAIERALHYGRVLRGKTPLGSVTRSIGSLAVDELRRQMPEAQSGTVLVVGAGEIGKLAVRALRRRVGRILVVSRSGTSAQEAAAVADGEVVALGDIARAIDVADGVISAADTRGTLLTADLLSARVARRRLVIVDIAMPRSVAAAARILGGLCYRTVDDLGSEATVPPEVIAECDFTGSTAAMADYVGKERPARVVLLTECSMSDNVALQYPDLEFVRPCNLCPHMKRITLPKIRHSLETMTNEVTVDPVIAERARHAVERMLALG